MILIDSNIFLEILLEQEAKERCKHYLTINSYILIKGLKPYFATNFYNPPP